jgi:deoxyribonuclease V
MWPASAGTLIVVQDRLARAGPAPWQPSGDDLVAGCFVCFPRGGEGPGGAGDRAWVGAAATRGPLVVAAVSVVSSAGAAYRPGLLALREGPALEQALNALEVVPDVLLVNATGRDHPRRAGLALHLGAVLGVPTVGVTDRTLVARGGPPGPLRGDRAPLRIGSDVVGAWVRTRPEVRPVAVHAAWRTGPDDAIAVVLETSRRSRTPEPLRRARTMARRARSADPGG